MLGLLRRKGRRRLGKTKRDQKRRDKKGRILRNGESQRKDGRYAFVYTDCYGKQKFLYSWKLEPTDSLPTGCRPCLALIRKLFPSITTLCLFNAHAQNSINRTKIAKTTECPTVLSNPMNNPKAIAIPTIINEQI